jgi:hypothetical protein
MMLFLKWAHVSRGGLYISVIPAFRRLRQMDREFEATQGDFVSKKEKIDGHFVNVVQSAGVQGPP